MNVLWGVVVTSLSLLAWGGQAIAWFWPATAVRWNLAEAEDDVEPAFWADARGEARWDTLTLWTMVAAGVLLIVDARSWVYFGLVGGGMYVYFGGRGILTRLALMRGGFRVGEPSSVRLGLVMLGVWGVAGAITLVASVAELR